MPTARSRTFRSGNSQAVRLPREVAFPDEIELILVRSGDVLTMYPARRTVPEMVERLRSLPVPPRVEARDEEPIPERPGL